MPRGSRQQIDAAAWDVFARHQPYYHILSDPSMMSPGPKQQEEFWASGTRNVRSLQEFAGLGFRNGIGVDLGCGLGRLTRAMRELTSQQIGLDISSEMLCQAKEANRSFPSIEFRQIQGDNWPVATTSCVLVISLHVLQHMSTLELMEHSICEMGRVLISGGSAVFNIPTMRWRGQLVHWAKQLPTSLSSKPDEPLSLLEQRLARHIETRSEAFTEQQIMNDMFRLDCRRMKSLPLIRLRSAIKRANLRCRRLERDKSGVTLVALEKS